MRGIIEAISFKTNGIKINGRWINARDFLTQLNLNKGMNLEYETDGKELTTARVLNRPVQQQGTDHQNRNKEVRRLALLNTATNIIELAIKMGSIEGITADKIAQNTPEALKKRVLELAKELEKWVIE